MGKQIAIIGTSPQCWHLAPFGDEAWEIWGLSRLYSQIPRWDVWFELHRMEDLCKTWNPGNEQQEAEFRRTYQKWLAEEAAPKPVFVQPQYAPNYDHWQPYPIENVKNMTPYAYLTNTVSYMIALAIAMQPDKIGVWGVDMAMTEEYVAQRPSCEYWLGVAVGAGIEVVIPPESNLLNGGRLYGFERPNRGRQAIVAKRNEISQRLKQTENQVMQTRERAAGLRGFLDAINYVETNWPE